MEMPTLEQFKEEGRQEIQAEQAGIEPQTVLEARNAVGVVLEPLSVQDCVDITKWLEEVPPELEFIVEDILPVNVTGVINSPGGVGKSTLILLLSVCVAGGISIPPFKVKTARKVFMLNVEDGHDDIWRRFKALIEVYPEILNHVELIKKNLLIYPGRGIIKTFMRTEGGVPVITPDGLRMRQTLLNLEPELALFDTKSRLYGLEENSNDHAAMWWAMFEETLEVMDNDCTVLVASHSSQSGGMEQKSNRGASAFIDNARVNIVMDYISEKEAHKFNIDPLDYFKMNGPKMNYSRRLGVVYFKKLKNGIPKVVDLNHERFSDALDEVIRLIDKDHDGIINKRQLTSKTGGKHIREKIKDDFDVDKITFLQLINYGIESTRLTEKTSGSGLKPAVDITTKWDVSTVPSIVPCTHCPVLSPDEEDSEKCQ